MWGSARIAIGMTLLAIGVAPATAQAAADIEGTWSFNGGAVVVAPAADGSFTGTISKQTLLATCPHAVGEQMWLGLRRQPDGQYFGGHQWYVNDGCAPIPRRGNTAYRVLKNAEGKTFLRVCFAGPENPELQPTIAADGTSANTTAGCADSDLIAPPPSFANTVVLPKQGKKKCLSRRAFRIRLREPAGDKLVTATVFLNGRQIKVLQGARITAGVKLTGLPKGRYTLKIVAKTQLNRTIQGTRKYRTCTKKRRSSNRIRV